MADNGSGSGMSKEDAFNYVKEFLKEDSGNDSAIQSYTKNAGIYDQIVSTLGYQCPQKTAEYVHAFLKGQSDAKVLDVAAGSGLTGKELQKLGYTNMDAVDASEGLLEEAKSKDIYKKLMCLFVGPDNPMPVEDNTYDLAMASGSMGENQLPLSALIDVIRVVRPGGYIVNVFRETAVRVPMYNGNFDDFHNKLEAEGKWKLILREEFSGFFEDVLGLCLVYQVL